MVDFTFWFFSQITVFQAYDPDFLSGYGIGQSNGSLWTKYVEIQFYIVLPCIYLSMRWLKQSQKKMNALFLALMLVFVFPHIFYSEFFEPGSGAYKLLKASFLPYFFMFLVGVVFQRYFDQLIYFLEDRFVWLLGIYLLSYVLVSQVAYVSLGNRIQPFL